MTPAISVQRLRLSDLSEILPIERASYPTPWSVPMFVLELTRVEGVVLGARDGDGELAGYVICTPQADEWHVMNVTVAPARRRAGIARLLLRELHQVLETATGGRARLTLEVRPSNAAALALYHQEGYLVAGRRPSYYPDDREDALIMWRTPATRLGSFDDVPEPDLREAARWNPAATGDHAAEATG